MGLHRCNGKGVKLGGRHRLCAESSALQIMGKRSGLFFAILLIAGVVQVKLPIAAAQSSAGSDNTSDCPSGVISSVDGSCGSEEQAPTQGLGQLAPGPKCRSHECSGQWGEPWPRRRYPVNIIRDSSPRE